MEGPSSIAWNFPYVRAGLSPRRPLMALMVVTVLAQGVPSRGGPIDGVSSDNVEHIAHLPLEAGTATGARLVGDHLYVTSYRKLSIYDVSEPKTPELIGSLTVPGYAQNEDVDTNGRILLFSEELPGDTLHVVDVSDPARPAEVGALPGAGDHTTSCVLGCRFAYGADGTVVDLRDPQAPRVVGDWTTDLPETRGFGVHDVTEVRPGIVVTSSDPIMVLDVRKDPARPRLIAVGRGTLPGLFHSNLWPRSGRDRFLLVSTEGGTTAGGCDDSAGVLSVWDATGWRRTRTIVLLHRFTMSNGTHVDGKAAPGVGCSAHWFDTHPDFNGAGWVALGAYKHGVRFLEVRRNGSILEVGYFLGHGADVSAAYWINDQIAYSIDLNRGIDILRFKPRS